MQKISFFRWKLAEKSFSKVAYFYTHVTTFPKCNVPETENFLILPNQKLFLSYLTVKLHSAYCFLHNFIWKLCNLPSPPFTRAISHPVEAAWSERKKFNTLDFFQIYILLKKTRPWIKPGENCSYLKHRKNCECCSLSLFIQGPHCNC